MQPPNTLPRYPVFIPSKGRFKNNRTATLLLNEGVPFHLVVEPTEADEYMAAYGEDNVLVLPFHDLGQGSIPARNWIRQYSIDQGDQRHWQLDDNITWFFRRYKGWRIRCDGGLALALTEDFVERYTNVALAGLNYDMFVPEGAKVPPFFLNHRVYSCTLYLNSLPYQWRGRYNEDTDLCLQVLSGGWCTILMNAFLIKKLATMRVKGGNTQELYKGDGRLKMARALEREWPGVVRTGRRFKRPQHFVKGEWKYFDTQLILRSDFKLDDPGPNEYGMELKQLTHHVRSPEVKRLLNEHRKATGKDKPGKV